MRRIHIIYLTIFFYILLAALCPVFAKLYVDRKDAREYAEAYDRFKKVFADQDKYVFIDYSGEKVSFEKASLPKNIIEDYGFGIYSQKEKMEWKDRWAGIYKLCKLKPRHEPRESFLGTDEDRTWHGWRMRVYEKGDMNSIREYWIYPYQVAYKRQNDSWQYSYMPSVQNAIDESFEFFTKDDKSYFKDYIEYEMDRSSLESDLGINNIWAYYRPFSYDKYVDVIGKEQADSIINSKNWNKIANAGFQYMTSSHEPYYAGGMYNSYYRVDNLREHVHDWILTYNFIYDPKTNDKIEFIKKSEISISVLFFLIMIPLGIMEYRRRLLSKEGLRSRLLRLCNPKLFMKPYDENKVSSAIELYNMILNTQDDDIDDLKRLRKEVCVRLNVNFVDQERRRELRSLSNPKRYLNPYDAEKVKIANDLYTKLEDANIDIDSFENIELIIKEKLLDKVNITN